jgi:hypothetical protein
VGQTHAREAGLRAGDRAYSSPEISRRRLAADLDEVVARNNVLAKELAVLCAINTKISFKSLSRSSAKPLSLEQVIDLIDTARGGWGRRDKPQN